MATLEDAVSAISDKIINTPLSSSSTDIAYLSAAVDKIRGTVTQQSLTAHKNVLQQELTAVVTEYLDTVKSSVGLSLQPDGFISTKSDFDIINDNFHYALAQHGRTFQHSNSQFSLVMAERSLVTQKSQLKVIPFQINQTTGAILTGTSAIVADINYWGISKIAYGNSENTCVAWGLAKWGTNTSEINGGASWLVNEDNTVTVGSKIYSGSNGAMFDNFTVLPTFKVSNTEVHFYINSLENTSTPVKANCGVIDSTDGTMTTVPTLASGFAGTTNVNNFPNIVGRVIANTGFAGKEPTFIFTGTNYVNELYRLTTTPNTPDPNPYQGVSNDGTFGYELSNGETLIYTRSSPTLWYTPDTGFQEALLSYGGEFDMSGELPPYNYNVHNTTGFGSTKQADTFYVGTASGYLVKFTISGSNGTYSINIRGRISLKDLTASVTGSVHYTGLVTISGDNEQYIVVASAGQDNATTVKVGVTHNILREL